MKTKTLVLLVAASCSFPLLTPFASAQGTAFTYQGRLNSGTDLANGTYDLQFTIYAAGSGGIPLAPPLTNMATAVSNGLFTVTLQFGAGVFTGADRWLEIAVRTNGGGNFSTLTPRQPVTATPYAIQANSAVTAGAAAFATNAGSVTASNISGTIGVSQLPLSVVIDGDTGVTLSGTFAGNGFGLSNLVATQIASGTLADARLTANVALRAGGNTFFGNQAINGDATVNGGLHINTPGFPGVTAFLRARVGDTMPLAVQGTDGTLLLLVFTNGQMILAGGLYTGGVITGDGSGLSNLDASNLVTGIVANERLSDDVVIRDRFNIFDGPQIFLNGNIGIGTTNPLARLDVNGEINAHAFNTTSDREAKEEFQSVDAQAVLEKVARLSIFEWQFKTQAGTRHLGPMAQDFHEAFGLGRDDKHITSVDADGVALAAIQGLNEKVEGQSKQAEQRIEQLQTENAELKQRLEKLERLMAGKHGGAD